LGEFPQELSDIGLLREEEIRTGAGAAVAVLGKVATGENDYNCGRSFLFDPLQDPDAAAARQADVEDDHIRLEPKNFFDRNPRVSGLPDNLNAFDVANGGDEPLPERGGFIHD
jgi:hypothetical protein